MAQRWMIAALLALLGAFAVAWPPTAGAALPPDLRPRDVADGSDDETILPAPDGARKASFGWEPLPMFGPGSGKRGGWALGRWKRAGLRAELRLGLDDQSRETTRLLKEAQKTFNQPITREEFITDSAEEDERLGLLGAAFTLARRHRFVYLVVFFD